MSILSASLPHMHPTVAVEKLLFMYGHRQLRMIYDMPWLNVKYNYFKIVATFVEVVLE